MSLFKICDERTDQSDYHLLQLSAGLSRLDVSIADLGIKRPTSGRISGGGYITYWCVPGPTGPAVLIAILKIWLWPPPNDNDWPV